MRAAVLWTEVYRRLLARTPVLSGNRRLSARDVERVATELGAVIVERAAHGDRVTVPGLGLFRAKARKAREVVAPNGGHHRIEEQVVLTFRAAKCVRVLRRGE
jgi:nucleoid DNA-binding protein